MNDHDDLLRDALRDGAGQVTAHPDWEDVRRRASASTRRRWVPAAAAVLLVAGLAAGLLAVRGGEDDADVVTDDPTTSAEPPPTSSTSIASDPTDPAGWTISPGADVPPLLSDPPAGEALGDDEIVAAVEVPEGTEDPTTMDLVVLSIETGETLRTLASGYTTTEGGLGSITMTTDRRSVFFSYSTAACTSRLEVVPADGSSPPMVVVDDADDLAFADSGRFAIRTGDPCVGTPRFWTGDVDGGPTTVLTPPDDGPETYQSWAIDDEWLYVVPSGPEGSSFDVEVVELATGRVRSVERDTAFSNLHSGARSGVTVLEDGSAGSSSLVTLDGPEIVDRRPIGRGIAAWVLGSGRLLTIDEALFDVVFSVDGREVPRRVRSVGD